jgi:hypothetical protein
MTEPSDRDSRSGEEAPEDVPNPETGIGLTTTSEPDTFEPEEPTDQ